MKLGKIIREAIAFFGFQEFEACLIHPDHEPYLFHHLAAQVCFLTVPHKRKAYAVDVYVYETLHLALFRSRATKQDVWFHVGTPGELIDKLKPDARKSLVDPWDDSHEQAFETASAKLILLDYAMEIRDRCTRIEHPENLAIPHHHLIRMAEYLSTYGVDAMHRYMRRKLNFEFVNADDVFKVSIMQPAGTEDFCLGVLRVPSKLDLYQHTAATRPQRAPGFDTRAAAVPQTREASIQNYVSRMETYLQVLASGEHDDGIVENGLRDVYFTCVTRLNLPTSLDRRRAAWYDIKVIQRATHELLAVLRAELTVPEPIPVVTPPNIAPVAKPEMAYRVTEPTGVDTLTLLRLMAAQINQEPFDLQTWYLAINVYCREATRYGLKDVPLRYTREELTEAYDKLISMMAVEIKVKTFSVLNAADIDLARWSVTIPTGRPLDSYDIHYARQFTKIAELVNFPIGTYTTTDEWLVAIRSVHDLVSDQLATLKEELTFIETLELHSRSRRNLRAARIYTVEQLTTKTGEDLLSMPGIGPVIMSDIAQALAKRGLELRT